MAMTRLKGHAAPKQEETPTIIRLLLWLVNTTDEPAEGATTSADLLNNVNSPDMNQDDDPPLNDPTPSVPTPTEHHPELNNDRPQQVSTKIKSAPFFAKYFIYTMQALLLEATPEPVDFT